jgi:thiamine-monophosphate kinase
MDTSDGAIATLDQLVRLNGVGFTVESSLEEFIHKDALHIARAAGIPTWTVLAGLHGEFELLFTIPPERVDGFLAAASQNGWKPIYLGKAVVKPEIEMRLCDKLQILDTEKIRNLFAEVKGDVKEYIEGLIHMDAAFGESGT